MNFHNINNNILMDEIWYYIFENCFIFMSDSIFCKIIFRANQQSFILFHFQFNKFLRIQLNYII
jgi:hypothetical protein